MSDFQLGDALVFADTATVLLLDAHDRPADLGSYRAEIDQATGMLTEQLDVSITDAFVRLRAYAYVNDIQLADVARDIVARRLRLLPEPDLPLGDKKVRCPSAPAARRRGSPWWLLLISWRG